MWGRILVVMLAGCGRLGFDAMPGDAAAGSADGSCTLSAWSAPIPLASINTAQTDFGCQITGDGLTLYFDSDRDGTEDLFVATRTDRAADFGAPQKLLALDTSSYEGDPSPSPDGRELMFYQASDDCLLDARRATTTDQWSAPTVTSICTASGAFIAHDGLTLYYNTRVDVNDEGALMVSTRASTADQFTPGTPIAELASGATKGFPAVSRDQLAIYFESTGGGVDLDIWQATRASMAVPWGTPDIVTALPGNDGDASLTDDGLELFFSSTMAGSPDIYRVTRSCL